METDAEKWIQAEPQPGAHFIDFYEELLQKLLAYFHPRHFLVMKVKSQLISQYGNHPNLQYSKLSNELVERKWRLCQEFIDVFERVDPGCATDWWAVTQLEAIQARSILLQRDLEAGKIPASSFKVALIEECQKNMADVIRVLEFEQPGTYTQTQCIKAKKMLAEMNEIIKFADFL